PTALYTLSLHDALPIFDQGVARQDRLLLAHHAVRDGLADRDGGAGLVGRDPYDLGLESLALAQHEKTALERHRPPGEIHDGQQEDRKSTRLNSSHVAIS